MMLKIKSVYQWIGIDKIGMKLKGTLVARDREELINKCNEQEIVLIWQKRRFIFSFDKKYNAISFQQFKDFVCNVAHLLENKLTLNKALIFLNRNYYQSGEMCKFINEVKKSLEEGGSFSGALQRQFVLDDMTTAIIQVGEKTGTLYNTLRILIDYQNSISKIRSQLFRALSYPALVLCVSLLIVVALLFFIVPQFKSVFQGMGPSLPMVTRVVLFYSDFLRRQWWLLFPGLLLVTALSIFLYQKSKLLRQKLMALLAYMPMVRSILVVILLIRWTKIMATTLLAGMTVCQALEMACACLQFSVYEKGLKKALARVRAGQSLHHALLSARLFPLSVIEIIAVGEMGGNLLEVFQQIAKNYQQQLDLYIERLSKWLEPVMMIILAILLGVVVVAMYVPIFQLGMAF